MNIASLFNLAGPDLIIILGIVLLMFGAKKLPELARGMGQAIKEFQKAKDEFSDELHTAGKGDVATAKPDVRPAPAAVPRLDDGGMGDGPRRETAQQVAPDRTDRV